MWAKLALFKLGINLYDEYGCLIKPTPDEPEPFSLRCIIKLHVSRKFEKITHHCDYGEKDH